MEYPEYSNDPEGVRKILTHDWICRRRLKWPLVELANFHKFITGTEEPEPILLCQVKTEHGMLQCPDFLNSTKYVNLLYSLFPSLPQIFQKYQGKIAVCGGSIMRILRVWNFHFQPKGQEVNEINFDCDLFFYNTSSEEAEAILSDCVAFMSSSDGRSENSVNPRLIRKDKEESKEFETVITRNDNVVNVTHFYQVYYDDHGQIRTRIEKVVYQFILRIYPTLDSIIGGFDIGCCMTAFDGKRFYATPLGAWSLMKNANIIDTTRRSTSFEYRLCKYFHLGFSIIFPGLETLEPKRNFKKEEIVLQLKQIMFDNGAKLDVSDFVDESVRLEEIIEMRNNIVLGKGLSVSERYVTMNRNWLPDGWRIKSPIHSSATIISSEEILKKYSDYSAFEFFPKFQCSCDQGHDESTMDQMEYVHGAFLRCNNRTGFFTAIQVSRDRGKASEEFSEFVKNPPIIFDEKDYEKRLEKYIERHLFSDDEWSNRSGIILMGEFLIEFTQLRKEMISDIDRKMEPKKARSQKRMKDFYSDKTKFNWKSKMEDFRKRVTSIMTERMKTNAEMWKKDLSGLKWRTKNPGTQWTSSINPIMENPRMFYGQYYKRFVIGIPEDICWTLLLIRKEKGSSLYSLPSDLFNHVMNELCFMWKNNSLVKDILDIMEKHGATSKTPEGRMIGSRVMERLMQKIEENRSKK